MQNQLLMMFAAEVPAEADADILKREVIGRIEKEQRKQKHYFDKSRRPARQYLEGELVLVEKDPQATGLSKKLEPKYKGPYLVERALGNDRYLIVDVPGVQLKQKKTSTIFAADRMKPWSVNASLEDSDDDNMSSEDSDETM